MKTRLHAARRLVVAEGEWFHAMEPEMQKQYLEEHPGSKYAKDHTSTAPANPKALPAPTQKPKSEVKPASPKPTPEEVKKVSPKAKAAGSKERVDSAKKLKATAPGLASQLIGGVKDFGHDLSAVGNFLNGHPEHGDMKRVGSMLVTLLGTGAMMTALGATGPVGFLAFMALKKLALPELVGCAKSVYKGTKRQFAPADRSKMLPEYQDACVRLLAASKQDQETLLELIELLADMVAHGEIPQSALDEAQAELEATHKK
jgi:hypothetical protein